MDLGEMASAADCFGQAGDLWSRLLEAGPGRADLRHERARAHFNRGYALSVSDRRADAIGEYRRALDVLDGLLAGAATVPVLYDFGRGSFNLSMLLEEEGDAGDALEVMVRALPRFAELTRVSANVPQFRRDLHLAADRAEQLAAAAGDIGRAAEVWREATAARSAAGDAAAWNAAGTAALNAANWFRDAGRLDLSEEAYRTAAHAFTEPSRQDPAPRNRLLWGVTLFDCGLDLRAAGRWDSAEEMLRRSARVLGPLAAEFPAEPSFRHHLAGARNNLGILYADSGRDVRAEAAYRESLALRSQVLQTHPDDEQNRLFLGGTLCNLGNVFLDRGDHASAREFYAGSLRMLDQVRQGGRLKRELDGLLRSFLANATAGRDRAAGSPVPPLPVASTATAAFRPAGPPVPDEFLAAAALADDPESRDALLSRGHLRRSVGDAAGALADADAALAADREDADAWFLRGLVLGRFLDEQGGDVERFHADANEEAINSLDEAILCRPDWFEARLYKARALARSAHAASAHLNALADFAARQAPSEAVRDAWLRPAILAFRYARDRAREAFAVAVRLHPDDPDPAEESAALERELGPAG
jgi:tetratricopeptide (TPR) repeat protein